MARYRCKTRLRYTILAFKMIFSILSTKLIGVIFGTFKGIRQRFIELYN